MSMLASHQSEYCISYGRESNFRNSNTGVIKSIGNRIVLLFPFFWVVVFAVITTLVNILGK